MKIYHNTRCRKSRETLGIIRDSGAEVEIVEYLRDTPTVDELGEIVKKLGISPLDLIRKNESVFKENFKGQDHTDAEWLQIMADNPILIERPIVIKDNKAVIGRPPEKVRELL